jgi:hypothetical protein
MPLYTVLYSVHTVVIHNDCAPVSLQLMSYELYIYLCAVPEGKLGTKNYFRFFFSGGFSTLTPTWEWRLPALFPTPDLSPRLPGTRLPATGQPIPLWPMSAVRDLTRDGRWSTCDVIVLKLSNVSFRGKCARMGNTLTLP